VRAALAKSETPRARPQNATGRALAFVVTASGRGDGELWAYDLERQQVLWRKAADVTGRAAIGREVVVYGERDGALVARDLRSGDVRWRKALPEDRARVGYAVDGDAVFEAQIPAGARGRAREGTLLAYEAGSGGKRWAIDLAGPLGGPAARGGVVAIPRQSQYVTLIDASDGDLLADILSREQEASFVRGLPEGFVFGSRGVFLASAKTALGQKDGGGYVEAKTPAFVRPLYYYDTYRPEQGEYSALDRNRLLWRLTSTTDRAAFAHGQVVVHNFRFFFGLDASSGELRWAYNHPRTDAMASELTGPSVIFVSADGALGALDARTGRRTFEATLPGRPTVVGASFDADGFEGAGAPGDGASLASVLSSILWDPDRRFSDVRLYAVDELVRRPGRDATEELLKALDMGDQIPEAALKKAVEALVARQDRSMLDLYVRALQVHPDYVEDRRPKRLDFFARAVASLKAKEAVPALVDHLRLPDTDPDVVKDIGEAVLGLRATEAVTPFLDFLMQYRADVAFARMTTALTTACDVLLELGGPTERAALLFVAEDPLTLEVVSAHIKRALEQSGK
jgi:outer membrane protein assembly factor BamB